MKIVQLITRMDETGGAQIHIRDLAVSLSKMGHEIYVMAGSENLFWKDMKDRYIPYFYIKNLERNIHIMKDIKAFFEVRDILKKLKPDLLAVHSSKAGMIGRVAGWSLGIPTVFTAHGWSFTEGIPSKSKYFYVLFEKMAGKISSGIITVSEYDQHLAKKYKIAPVEKMATIRNGVPATQVKDLANPRADPPRMVMVARFAEPKEQRAVVSALNKMRKHNWTMDFVGDGPLRESVEQYASQLDLSDRIRFLGNQHNIDKILLESQIFILISKWEGLPLSILEAMRSGLPVVASDVGGVRETIKQSRNGFLIPKGNEKELIDKLTLLINDPLLRKEMGNTSRNLYLTKFTFERMIAETICFYEQSSWVSRNKNLKKSSTDISRGETK